MIQKVAENASIVLIGSFNPGIFHPAWFEKQGLLQSTETQNATIEIVNNDIAIFSMSWVRIEVVNNRFVAKTNDVSSFGLLRDLVLGTFRLLEFTPTVQLGLNREVQYKLASEETWHAVGHTLAPKEPWSPYVQKPGMKVLTMETARDDDRNGFFNITIKPAKGWCVDISMNDHIELGEDKTAADACNIIAEDWEKSVSRADHIASGLITDNAK